MAEAEAFDWATLAVDPTGFRDLAGRGLVRSDVVLATCAERLAPIPNGPRTLDRIAKRVTDGSGRVRAEEPSAEDWRLIERIWADSGLPPPDHVTPTEWERYHFAFDSSPARPSWKLTAHFGQAIQDALVNQARLRKRYRDKIFRGLQTFGYDGLPCAANVGGVYWRAGDVAEALSAACSADEGAKPEAPIRGHSPQSTRTVTLRTRRSELAAEIDLAKGRATCPTDYHSVWTALRDIALESTPPFTGVVSGDGIQYTNSKGKVVTFTKDALRNRMRRGAR